MSTTERRRVPLACQRKFTRRRCKLLKRLNLTLASASEHEIYQARLQCRFSHDSTLFRVRIPGSSTTIVTGHNGADDGQKSPPRPATISLRFMETSRAEITTRNRLCLPAREWCAPPYGMRQSRRLGLHGGAKPVLFRIDGKSGGITRDPARARCRILDAARHDPGHAANNEATPLQCVQTVDSA
jgi:hypothetical protein